MGGGGPDIPPPPDPYATAAAQGQFNVQAAETQARLNRIGQITPFGSTTYENVPGTTDQYQQRMTLSPAVQGLTNAQMVNQRGVADLARAEQVRALYTPKLTMEGLPQMHTGFNFDDRGLPRLSPFQFQDAILPQLPGSEGYEVSRARVEEALLSRIEPQFQRQRSQMEARMAEQGIPLGSEAYSASFDELNRALADQRMAAVLAGGQEQSRLAALDMAARQQGFGEQTGAAELNRAIRGQALRNRRARNS